MSRESTPNPYLDLSQFFDDAIARYPSNRIYCLADHAGLPGLHRELVRADVQWKSLFEGSKEEAALQVAPLLFPLTDSGSQPGSKLLRWLSEHGTFTSSFLLFSSSLTVDELGAALLLRTQARISEGMDVLLRYFDPRVFEALMAVLRPSEKKIFLGVADCWWYPNRSGKLVQEIAESEAVDTFESPLLLSATQEFSLLDMSEIDQVASQLSDLLPAPSLQLGGARFEFLKRQMMDAKAAGIESTHELTLYCGLALLHGEDFASSATWQPLLADVRNRKIKFTEAVAAVEE